MTFTIKNKKVIIRKGNFYTELPLMQTYLLLEDPILQYLDFQELFQLWKGLFGIPTNIKEYLEQKIKLYDKSESVNSFIINNSYYWLDKETRLGIMHLANCSKDNIQLVLGDKILTIPVDKAKDFLAQLEVYAGQCYLQTQKHLLAIKELKTIEDIINYDYTKGYPEKITFNYE